MTSSNTPPLPTSLAELPQLLRTRAPLVTVIGDHILDGWWAGRTERMKLARPMPVAAPVMIATGLGMRSSYVSERRLSHPFHGFSTRVFFSF